MPNFGPTQNHDLDPCNESNEQVKEDRQMKQLSDYKMNLWRKLQSKICFPIDILKMFGKNSNQNKNKMLPT